MSILGLSTRTLLTVLVAAAGLAVPAGSAGSASSASSAVAARRPPLPQHINLPDGFQPEGIATRGGPTAYLGSLATGNIYAANLLTGKGRVISKGDGTPAVGLKLDRRGRLWVAGGADGDAKVVSARTGRVLANYRFTTRTSFVNDVVLRRRAAWFTDSQRAVLYKVRPRHGRHGRAAAAKVRTVALRGAWRQIPNDFNANGISTTPDRRALLVVQTATGYLFRVNPHTGNATRVNLGSTVLTNGDGLHRLGRRLYVAQNLTNRVLVLRLGRHGRVGHLARTLTSSDLDVPTTIASYRSGLYLPNARFTTPPTPTTKYWITRIGR